MFRWLRPDHRTFTLMGKHMVMSAEAGFPASRLTREEAVYVAELARRGRSAYAACTGRTDEGCGFCSICEREMVRDAALARVDALDVEASDAN